MVSAPSVITANERRERFRFTREAYESMISAGILDENDRVELISGEILTKMSIGPSHASTLNRLNRFFSRVAGDQLLVTVQNPIALDDFSEPEPDLALVRMRSDMYNDAHPTPPDVYLIIEVADTSVRFDRERKIPLYAAAGIPEAWLIDLVERCLIRYRTPANGAYTDVSRHASGDSLPIPGLPDAQLAIADLRL
jgi:Uma2 family endonuclease